MISRGVADRMCESATSLASQSLDELSDRLDRHGDTMPIGDVRETAALALRLLGYPTT